MHSIDRLHELFEDVGTNVKRRVSTSSRGRAGAVPVPANDGYCRIMVDTKSELVHRVLWAMRTGEWPHTDVDHIDGDRGNNAPNNLRLTTRAQNLHNQTKRTDNTSGYKGVTRRRKAWQGLIMRNGVLHKTALFQDKELCAAATQVLRTALHGEYTNHGV